jgi:hypothetical protein
MLRGVMLQFLWRNRAHGVICDLAPLPQGLCPSAIQEGAIQEE